MRICFFIPSLGDGGAQRQCIALLNAMQRVSDVELHLILLGPGEHEQDLDASGLHLHRKDVGNFANPAALVFVVRVLRRVRPDLLLSWLHPADIWSHAATRLVRGTAWVIAERGSAYPDRLVFNLRRRIGRVGTAAIIANSDQGRSFWMRMGVRSPVWVIPNMVLDAPPASGVALDRRGSRICLFVGRLEAEKNVGEMTVAFASFAAGCHSAELVIAGQGSHSPSVRQIALDEGLGDRVQQLGFRRDIPLLMSRARVLLSFSEYEGMPNVLMEAIGAGLPAVVSDIPEHRALLGDDYPYYVRLRSSADSAADVIRKAWTHGSEDPEALYAHARGVLRSSEPDTVVAAYLDAFANVLGTGDRSGPADRRDRRQRASTRTYDPDE